MWIKCHFAVSWGKWDRKIQGKRPILSVYRTMDEWMEKAGESVTQRTCGVDRTCRGKKGPFSSGSRKKCAESLPLMTNVNMAPLRDNFVPLIQARLCTDISLQPLPTQLLRNRDH